MSLDITLSEMRRVAVFQRNITHAFNDLAKTAGIYQAIWRPEEINITRAYQLKPILQAGLRRMKASPEYYRRFAPKLESTDGYTFFVEFVQAYIKACKESPQADIRVWR